METVNQAQAFVIPCGIVATTETVQSQCDGEGDEYTQCEGCGIWIHLPAEHGTYMKPETCDVWCDAICLRLWCERGSRSFWELDWEEASAVDLARARLERQLEEAG